MSIERWEIHSSHSQLDFAVRHFVIGKTRGRFSRWSGSIQVPDGDWNRASVQAVIDASSIETGNSARDAHLRAADYLDVKRYPEIVFRAQLAPGTGIRRGRLVGELTLKGRTREVALEIEGSGVTRDSWGNDRTWYTARATFDRREFGMTGNLALDSHGIVIGERIAVEIKVEAVRRPATRVA
jgi:polyisoprenoid-binding protein YceI